MFLFLLVILSVYSEIMGRPSSINENLIENIPAWWLRNDIFVLPSILKVGETVNITIVAKQNTKTIEIILMGHSGDQPKHICSFKADIASKTAKISFNGKSETEQVELEHFILTEEPDKKVITIMFHRREGDANADALQLESPTWDTAAAVENLDDMRYFKISGDGAKVSNLQFDFV